MDNSKPGTKPHYKILDGLRGIAAIIVVFFHLAEPLATSHLDNHAFFLWCSVLVAAVLLMPRIGGAEHLWMNGLYEAFCIIIVFPLIVYIGASGVVHSQTEDRVCKFLGDLSYPLYITHYVLVYFYVAWVSNHKGVTSWQALPYSLLTFSGAIILAYGSLKLFDEPISSWLRKKLK